MWKNLRVRVLGRHHIHARSRTAATTPMVYAKNGAATAAGAGLCFTLGYEVAMHKHNLADSFQPKAQGVKDLNPMDVGTILSNIRLHLALSSKQDAASEPQAVNATVKAARTEAIQRCGADYSCEITTMSAKKVESFAKLNGLKPGMDINVPLLRGGETEETVNLCKRLVTDGMKPVAHVPARLFKNLSEVEEYLRQLKSIGVDNVLCLGGGADTPAGDLHETMQILESGLLQKYGFTRVGVAAHPEGHPDVPEVIMTEALVRKVEWARQHGVQLYFATQFCFDPESIIAWESRTRELLTQKLGTKEGLPAVHLGVAGPAKISTLIKFSLASGVGPSVRFLTKYSTNVVMLATTAAPDFLISGIAEHQQREPDCMIQKLHYYCFGGVGPTLRWANSVADGNFDLSDESFTVRK
eukprot:gnl/TRDRNA2_/TRDRNA2_187117_c0_seq1.p1 gnl/TRDRNA2_/TRDRNA2_187117_c0~~gnl/TRDRNA2_/TRDRNA2_187117_c0_seq1.p1  ORF type:complete len:413 (-),score=37.66 gnl/TRDRNA2_/TRDRNA2_187117_c0_seq1:205-1443(-)